MADGWDIAAHVFWARPENVLRLARALGVELSDPPSRKPRTAFELRAADNALRKWRRRAARLIRERLEDGS